MGSGEDRWDGVGTPISLDDHSTRHEDGSADEISVTALSGLLADDQHVLDAEVKLVFSTIVCFEDKVVCNNNEVVYN